LDQSNVMIVVDNPASLHLLEDILQQQGHEVRSFPSGRLALAAAISNPPDLILLDMNLPEMNGYELCERLKSTGKLSDIPVIFLSALNEIPDQDKVRAFRSGVVDYISKPFQFEEIRIRVETHLKLQSVQRALKLQNARLQEALAARILDLAEANQRLTILDSSKNEFLNLFSHTFRTPLNGLLGVAEFILEGMSSTAENKELRQLFERSRRRILSVLDDILLLTQIGMDGAEYRSVSVRLSGALNRAVERAAELAESRRVALALPSGELGLVLGDEELLIQAFRALLETAVKFSREGEPVRITCDDGPDSVRVTIESDGGTIPGSALAGFFDPFTIGEGSTPGGDLGLGPALAYRIFSLFSASVTVMNRDRSGLRLTILLKNAIS
jgi:two-component system sensor histidine kinase/response regulator